jgi:hypothetical protein
MPQVTYSKSLDVKPYISANWYEQDEIWNSVCVYPVQKTEPVDNPGNVYIAPLAPSSQNTLSVNNAGIGDGSDYVEQVFDIQGSLEHVNQPQCSLPPAFTYTPPPYGASTVYAFFGKWQVVGKSEVEIADPSWLDNDILRANEQFGKLGVLVHCLSNNVYYRCTQEYIPFNMEKQTPVQYAVFLPFVVYSNVGFATIEDVDKYINNHKVPDNTLGFYTVSNKHGQYIMPEQWINAGGKLEVVLEKESSKLKVRVWGADLSLNLPITTQNPNVSGYAGKDGDFVGLDISGGVTSNTIVYKYDNTRNVGDKWATVDGDVYDVIYPYQPYHIAIVTNEKEYDGLYITGNGIRYTPHTETIMSSNSEINAEQDEDNTLVIDNPYCTDQPTALKIANEVDAYSNGITYTFSGDVKHFSDSAIIKAHKGSFDYVTEFALENTAHGTYNEDSTFFKNQNENTFAEITDYIMNQSSLHVADTEFGNIAGAFIKINNRSYFRITEATITPSGISISGYAMMTLGDWDNAIAALDKNMTLGDWDAELSAVNQRERQDGYTLEMWEQELLRLTV